MNPKGIHTTKKANHKRQRQTETEYGKAVANNGHRTKPI